MKGIIEHYLKLHSELGTQKDAPDKEVFDTAHRKLWGDCEDDLSLHHTELVAKPKPTDEEKQEIIELKRRIEHQ